MKINIIQTSIEERIVGFVNSKRKFIACHECLRSSHFSGEIQDEFTQIYLDGKRYSPSSCTQCNKTIKL